MGRFFMEINRKIALIILAGLLAGLFGSFSFLMAMETAVIKDFNGQTVQLDDTQRVALSHCETLKHMIADIGTGELPFEGIAPFITNQNLQCLAQLIKDERNLDQIPQNEFMELFQCADYMKAPKKSLSALADRMYEPLRKKIEETVNEDEKANLELLCETVESDLSYYPDLSSLLKNKKELRKKIAGDVGISMSSGQRIGKKLKLLKKFKSLDGVEALSDQAWTRKVKDLRIEGHEIPKLNFAQIKKAFPEVTHVLLKDNTIGHISNVNASNITIDLKNNPIETIIIDNPRLLKHTNIVVDKDAKPIVMFNQSRFDKCAAWLEALKAQGKVAINRPDMLKDMVLAAGCSGLASCVGVVAGCAIAEIIMKKSCFLDIGDFKIASLATFCGTMGVCGYRLAKQRNQIRQELAQLAHQDGDHVNVCWTEPSHHGNTRTVITHSCPSKYAYNLLGQN